MPGEMPPPIEVYQKPGIHREAPDRPAPVVSKTGEIQIPLRASEDITDPQIPIVTFGEATLAHENRAKKKAATLFDEAAEAVMRYIEKQGLFVDKEPEQILNTIKHSELFENEILHILRTASQGENGLEQNPTDVSSLVSTQKDKTGEIIETQQGFYIQPSVTLLNDPETQHAWKHDYFYNFQDRETWQRIFPGTEPTLLQQEEADQILTEAESTAKEIQDDFKKTGGYFEPTPERLAKADTILKSLNIDAEEFAASLTDIHDLQGLLLPDVLAPTLVDAKKIKEIALLALTRDNVHPNDLQKYLNDFQKSNQAMNGFKAYIESVPAEKRRDTDFFIGFKKQFGEDKLKTLLRFKNAFTGDISDQSVNTDLEHVNRFEKAQDETE
jgi:hypothetical protein